MALYPVIMCGGAGTRLWPASRPSRPKQFIPLAGNRSLFQETALRVAPLAGDAGRLVVVGGVSHREWILDQLAEIGLEDRAAILLEPQARDSAAAMAAAALWTAARDAAGINVFVASDHHIPDHNAFRAAAAAAAGAAREGRIVTLGVRPTEPSSAYGYISPDGPGLSAVRAFREKPDARTAAQYIEAGYLWNSGNFIVQATTLLDELRDNAPGVEIAVRQALGQVADITTLGPAFGDAPKISIDYAVMEKTRRASVLEVDFEWSDLGAWDSIAATGEGDFGQHIFEDAEGCLVRAPEGTLVAALGVRDLAIVVEPDAVLVCDLRRAQDVKRVVSRIQTGSPQHLDFSRPKPEPLDVGARRFADWLRLRALPLWSSLGQDEDGAFAEALSLDGRPVLAARRAHVQARQIRAFAEAGRLGWGGPWRDVVSCGVDHLRARYLRDDGLCRTLLSADGQPIDETALVHDQAFVMLAMQAARDAVSDPEALERCAVAMRDRLEAEAFEGGLLKGTDPGASPAEAGRALMEAAMAWEAAGGDAGWGRLADRVAALARETLIDAESGFIRESARQDGSSHDPVLPGRQFEWAGVLARRARLRSDPDSLALALRLYAYGLRGAAGRDGVVVDALDADGRPRDARARLQAQTAWLRAAIALAGQVPDGERTRLTEDAAAALRAVWLHLTPDGLWRDKRLAAGRFIDEAASASALHALVETAKTLASLGGEAGDSSYLR